jgi:glycosyltransferase involved in cell wall biosynthesis
LDTYSYAKKPIFHIPVPTCKTYPWPEDKDYDACRKNFLWFGSHGLVHKGLDLVLDAFADMPEYHLTVCGPLQSKDALAGSIPSSVVEEQGFVKAYHKELYETPNIHTAGWVSIQSQEFAEITDNCMGIIYPSCAEGGGASVITCLQAGLIPVVSYESSVDVGDFGVILKDSSIDEIRRSIKEVSSLPAEELKQRSRKAWDFARANHTIEKYAEEHEKAIKKILAAQ